MRSLPISLVLLFAASFASAAPRLIVDKYDRGTEPAPYNWPANSSVTIAVKAQESGWPIEFGAKMGLGPANYFVKVAIKASGETITEQTYLQVHQNTTDQASVVAPLFKPTREIRAGEPLLITIMPLADIKWWPNHLPDNPTIKLPDTPPAGLSFYLKAAEVANITLSRGTGGTLEVVEPRPSCLPACNPIPMPIGVRARFRAVASTGHLVAWSSPPCLERTAEVCYFTLRQNATVRVDFPPGFTLTIIPDNYGGIHVDSFDCPQVCSQKYAAGAEATLTAQPAGNRRFGGWTGGCAGQPNPCKLTMNANATVGVSFPSGR